MAALRPRAASSPGRRERSERRLQGVLLPPVARPPAGPPRVWVPALTRCCVRLCGCGSRGGGVLGRVPAGCGRIRSSHLLGSFLGRLPRLPALLEPLAKRVPPCLQRFGLHFGWLRCKQRFGEAEVVCHVIAPRSASPVAFVGARILPQLPSRHALAPSLVRLCCSAAPSARAQRAAPSRRRTAARVCRTTWHPWCSARCPIPSASTRPSALPTGAVALTQ